jgi:CRP/FNR family transcriptional regulator, cyclic AMP receptor protein
MLTEVSMSDSAPAGTHLLSGLPAQISADLFEKSRTLQLAADAVLFLEGDRGDGCYRIDRGLLKVSVISSTGGERILAILGPGAVVGELSILDELPRSASVTAIRDSQLSFISRQQFAAVAKAHPEIYRHITNLLAARLRDTNMVVAAASFLPLKGRVARALIDLATAFGEDVGGNRTLIRQKISQSDVAAMAGIARENVSRILNEWIRNKIISRVSGYYCLDNKPELEEAAKL